MDEFLRTFTHYVTESGRDMEEISLATGMPCKVLVAVQEGKAMLGRDELIIIAFVGLRLDQDEVDDLLGVAGYAPLLVQARP